MNFETRDKRISDLINLIKMYSDFEIGPEEIRLFIKNTKELDGLNMKYLLNGLPFMD